LSVNQLAIIIIAVSINQQAIIIITLLFNQQAIIIIAVTINQHAHIIVTVSVNQQALIIVKASVSQQAIIIIAVLINQQAFIIVTVSVNQQAIIIITVLINQQAIIIITVLINQQALIIVTVSVNQQAINIVTQDTYRELCIGLFCFDLATPLNLIMQIKAHSTTVLERNRSLAVCTQALKSSVSIGLHIFIFWHLSSGFHRSYTKNNSFPIHNFPTAYPLLLNCQSKSNFKCLVPTINYLQGSFHKAFIHPSLISLFFKR
jgi:hypothetical protein